MTFRVLTESERTRGAKLLSALQQSSGKRGSIGFKFYPVTWTLVVVACDDNNAFTGWRWTWFYTCFIAAFTELIGFSDSETDLVVAYAVLA